MSSAGASCVFLVSAIWMSWLQEQTLTTISRTDYDVWNIYYPGISFCSNNKVDTDSWEKFVAKQMANWTEVRI